MTTNKLIRLEHVSLRYESGNQVLDDVSLELAAGEWLCVLGANGSGKSTLAGVVAGLLAPDAGTVELAGERVCADSAPDLEAYRRARRSLGLVFQNPDDQIVTSVVEDDVAFGPENLGLPADQIRRRVDRELERVALGDFAKANPTKLSGGQKQRVCIAGALAMEPQVLVLDEPASLLDVRGREAILRVMRRLSAAGTALVHVTHFMEEALLADRVIVLDHGRVALEGTPEEVFAVGTERLHELGLEEPGVYDGYMATAEPTRLEAPVPKRASAPKGSPIIRLSDVSYSYTPSSKAVSNLSFDVAGGESAAVIGQTGSGKSTLLRLICGLEVPDDGSVEVAGASTSTKRGRRAVRASVGYVMQHAERQLFAETVEKDVAFGPSNLGLPADEVARRVDAALGLVGLLPRRDASPFSLSGGQKRLAALAGILAMEPRILVLDEPMAGLDPRGRALLSQVLARLHSQGVTLLQVTHSMEAAAACERVIVLDGGKKLLEGVPSEVFSTANEGLLKAAGLGLPRSSETLLGQAAAHSARPSAPQGGNRHGI